MAHDASGVLGAQQLAGVKVNPRGFGKSTARKFGGAGAGGGAVGAVSTTITQAIATNGEKAAKQSVAQAVTPQFGVIAWLAVTESELALVELKRERSVGLQVHAAIARLPRSEVASTHLGRGILMAPPLTISFTDGTTWELEVPITQKRHAKNLVHTSRIARLRRAR